MPQYTACVVKKQHVLLNDPFSLSLRKKHTQKEVSKLLFFVVGLILNTSIFIWLVFVHLFLKWGRM